MKIFFITFQVVPEENNEHFKLVAGALALCWIAEDDAQAAYVKAKFFISKYNWKILEVETPLTEVTESHFLEKDIGLEHYKKAQEQGVAIVYSAWARDGKTTAGPYTLKLPYRFDFEKYLSKQKQLNQKGRCLHYNGSHRCKEIISAHSIQKNQSLEAIAQNGHVYVLSGDIGTLKKNKGRLAYRKCGIRRVSTFLGFCKKHDNELFEPIDNLPLLPTDEQVFLYAYRSLCRELFVKENSFDLVASQLKGITEEGVLKDLWLDTRNGIEFGLKNLRIHKRNYDVSLKEKRYSDINYVLFISRQKPFIAFSGLFYPEFDFMGRKLQDLGNNQGKLDLITFCTAPVTTGWGVLFAWNRLSSKVCVEFMKSLATMLYEGERLGNLILRLVFSNCENHAISPRWWESLSANAKEEITKRVTSMANIFLPTKPTYLMHGLEEIRPWTFERVIDNMN